MNTLSSLLNFIGSFLKVTSPAANITATTGDLVSVAAKQYGKVVQIGIKVKNTSSVAAGDNIFTGTLNTTALRPFMWSSGGSYISSYSINGSVSANGLIVIRNSDSRAYNNSGELSITFTYLVA